MSIVIILALSVAVALITFLVWWLLNRVDVKDDSKKVEPTPEQLDVEVREFRQNIRDEIVYQLAMAKLMERASGTVYEPFVTVIVAKGEELLYERNKEKRLSIIAERDKLYATLQELIAKTTANQ